MFYVTARRIHRTRKINLRASRRSGRYTHTLMTTALELIVRSFHPVQLSLCRAVMLKSL
jgi:hypothetical protein